uniref:Uncharacterized protein n=1 Tax=Meloidogyne javanica TaxID=6303 RepID=A0A915N6E2_MELJA
MLRFLIITCLIIKTHSWTWKSYPSPRGPDHWKCRVTRPTNVCDPDGMLTDQEREEIVQLVEDFKEKTKRPNSIIPCMREGLRLDMALAENTIGGKDTSSGITKLCTDKKWTSSDTTSCDSVVQGIELNAYGFLYCYYVRQTMVLQIDEYVKLAKDGSARVGLVDGIDPW